MLFNKLKKILSLSPKKIPNKKVYDDLELDVIQGVDTEIAKKQIGSY